MSKEDTYKAPRGTYDILPAESMKWEWLIRQFREVANSFNFKEIITPIFEIADLFERSVGGSTDIVEKEMYKFTDRKGRVFALRPEGTAPVVRSYIENNLQNEAGISKLYYIGPMFRYDRPQKGRFRQFYQYGIEQIGSDHPYIDAETIHLALMFIKRLGLSDYRLEVNSIGCSECSKVYDEALISYFNKYLNDLCPDCKNRISKNPKRLLDCKVKSCGNIADSAPSMLSYLDKDCEEHFDLVKSYLDLLEISYIVNPRIVRGLDYYNRTAFELIDISRGTQNALLGGGRYDGLISSLGGNNTPAVGFAGGFERLIAAMERENLPFGEAMQNDVYVVAVGDEANIEGLKLTSKLRENGINVDFSIEQRSFKKQIKAASKANCRFALIIGEDELKNSSLTVKNLANQEQTSITKENLIAFLKKES